jgi:prophage tail gpP-like protein
MAEDVEVQLEVDGFLYPGWKSIRITRSIESIAGSFALDTTDAWDGEIEPWTIIEGNACRVLIGGQVVIDGYVDKRNPSGSDNSRTLGYTGKDRAGALVENSALLDRWTFRKVNVADFAAALAKPFGIKVSVQPGLVLPEVPKLVITPGDSPFEAIKKATGDQGVLIVSDGRGGIVLTRTGADRAAPLVEGENIKSASGDYDASERFYRYVIMTQTAGTDEASGSATRILAEAFDEGVLRKDRVLIIRPEKGMSAADAKRRADWEARLRAAKGEPVTVTVQGWTQPNGELWAPNATTHVYAPRTAGVDGDMVISQVDLAVDDGSGTIAVLRLVRPDAFTPEPKATVKESGGRWKELNDGGKAKKPAEVPSGYPGYLGALKALRKKAGQ